MQHTTLSMSFCCMSSVLIHQIVRYNPCQTTSLPITETWATWFLPVMCDHILIPRVLLLEDEHKTNCHSGTDYYSPIYLLYSEPQRQ